MDILLKKKWVGALLLIITCFYMSFDISRTFNDLYQYIAPTLKQEVGYFLPISIEDGVIVEPKNKIIQKQYGDKNKITVELNTETEELDVNNLNDGFYVTKNNLYIVNKAKNKERVQSLENFPNIKINEEIFSSALVSFEQYAYKTILVGGGILFLLWGFLSISFTSAIASIFIPERWNFKFRNILRVNTLMFVVYLIVNFGLLIDFSWLWLLVVSVITTVVYAKTQAVKE